MVKINKILYFSLPIFLLGFFVSNAYVASSPNYRIETDVVSFGGGLSTSTNYSIQDSLSDRALGVVSSASNSINSGPIPMYDGSISITYPGSVALSPGFKSDEGGQGNGEVTVIVTTDNVGGYNLYVKSNSSPALSSSDDSFSNYGTLISGTPDFDWLNSATDSRFGFTPEGIDVVQKYKDDGVSCNVGALNTTDKCWDSIETTNKVIATSFSENQPSGTETKIKLRSEAGSSRNQKAGSYNAEIVVTAFVR